MWDPPDHDLGSRLKLARTLVERGSDGEALEQFAWLWQNSLQVEPAWVGVRGSYLIAALRPLVARSPAARDRFAAFRDEAETRLPDRDALGDWFTLIDVLGEDERFVPWLERLDEATAIRAATFVGIPSRNSRAGTASLGSSLTCRWKNSTPHFWARAAIGAC